jgi:hypothetical protein
VSGQPRTHYARSREGSVPNWLDSEGRPFGLVFWRYMLPEGEIETPAANVVPFAEVAR